MNEHTLVQEPPEKWEPAWTPEREIELKKEINNLLWMNARHDLTLGDAETAACAIYEILLKACRPKGT